MSNIGYTKLIYGKVQENLEKILQRSHPVGTHGVCRHALVLCMAPSCSKFRHSQSIGPGTPKSIFAGDCRDAPGYLLRQQGKR